MKERKGGKLKRKKRKMKEQNGGKHKKEKEIEANTIEKKKNRVKRIER